MPAIQRFRGDSSLLNTIYEDGSVKTSELHAVADDTAAPFPSVRRPAALAIVVGCALLLGLAMVFLRTGHPTRPAPGSAMPLLTPKEATNILALTDDQLQGMTSGRLDAVRFEYITSTRALMARAGTACATPWLAAALPFPTADTSSPIPFADTRSITTYPNILALADNINLYNAEIAALGPDLALIVIPYRFQSERHTRTYATSLTVRHSAGLYTSRSAAEAFCIQELL